MAEANNANLISTLTTDFNVTPYYDDFDSKKDFYRLLFKPGYAVQARELTQLQTTLQNQIFRFGKHVFKEGDVVIPGGFHFKMQSSANSALGIQYVKINTLDTSNNVVNVNELVGETFRGAVSNVTAKIETVLDADGTASNTKTLYFSTYLNASAANSQVRVFKSDETLVSANGYTVVVANSNPTGYASWFEIQEGVYFAKDHFISFPTQSVILDRYNPMPTCKVGFYITEQIVNSSVDSSLLDPALEASNYSAPGADRLRLVSELSVRSYDDPIASPNFVTLCTVKDGVVQISNEKTQYNILGDSLARRTFEESGDYIIKGYNVTIQEHDQILDSTSNNVVNFGRFLNGNNKLLMVGIDSGSGYVKGYPVQNNDKYEIELPKPFQSRNVTSQIISTGQGQYVYVNEYVGTWELDKGTRINFYDTTEKRITNYGTTTGQKWSIGSQTGNNIGSGIVNSILYSSGTPGYDAAYLVYLSDIKMTGSNNFSNVRSMYYSGSGAAAGADILGANNSISNTALQAISQASLLYYVGANYVKTTKDRFGEGATTYYFNKTVGISPAVTLTTGGTVTVTHSGPTNEVIPYTVSSTLSDTDVIQDLQMVLTGSSFNIGPLWTTGTGTAGAGSTTLTGVGTTFTSLNVGDKIELEGFSNTWYVTAIANNTSLTVNGEFPSGVTTKKIFKAYKTGDIFNLIGKGVASGAKRTVVAASNTSLTFDIKETIPSSVGVTVTYKVGKTNTIQATKTLNTKRYVKINCATAGTTGPFCLGFSDVYRIRKIVKKTGSAPTTLTDGTDVTKYFILDNGQKDTMYDLANLVRNGINLGATDYLLVYLDYFTSSGAGYFSVDSYPIQDDDAQATELTIRTENIPLYTSPTTQLRYDLRNQLDFRPVKTSTATDATTIGTASTNPSNNSTTYNNTTNGLKFPVPSESLTYDYSFYMGRKDIVTLNKDGVISITEGIAAERPVVPDCLDTQSIIAVLDIAPYPSLSPAYGNVLGRRDLSCGYKKTTNRGYTMRDIGVLDQRIKNLEYYTSLTLLEKDALSYKVLDDNGNDRFKNGYFIDTFKDASLTAKGVDPDFRIIFDPSELSIRPLFVTDSFKYQYISGSGVAVNDNKITFAYSEIPFLLQPRVTNTRNLERGTYYFQGQITMIPNQDIWVDTSFAPDEVVSIKTDNSLISISTSAEPDQAAQIKKTFLYTEWGEWKTTITGFNLYRGGGASKTLVGRYNSEAEARAVAAQWTTQPKYVGYTGDWRATVANYQAGGQNAYNNWVNTYSARGDVATIETVYDNYRLGTDWFSNESWDSAAGGAKLISSNKIPFIRPQEIIMKVEGMKPYSKLHAFFDGVNVSQYITPLTAEQYPITLLRQPLPLDSTAKMGDDLIVDDSGNIYFTFKILADGPKFKTGDRKFIILDSEQLNPETLDATADASTMASAIFFADGTAQTLQKTVYSTYGYKKTSEKDAERQSYATTAELVLSNTWSPEIPPKGHCCFSPNARVLMADLTWKAIKDIVPGDKVVGDNGTINTVEKNKSIATGGRKMVNFNGGDWYSTNDHLFLTKSGWKTWDPQHVINDKNTKNDMFLIGDNKEKSIDNDDELKMIRIENGKVFDYFVPYSGLSAEVHDFDPNYVVHDLTLDGNQTYIVEGFVVHNCCVAYTVLVQVPADEEGIFVTSFDVFVQRKSTRKMWFELREMDSAGNVTDVQIPGSVVTVENPDIPVSTNGIDNPLNVRFNAPIFLFNNKPYAFVVHSYAPGGMTVDPDISMWISRLGEKDINTGEVVNQRQRMGTFFQTTNNKQWYEVPDVDLVINVYRADFQTGQAEFTIGQEPVEKFFLSAPTTSFKNRINDHFVTGDTITIAASNGTNSISIGDTIVGNVSAGYASGNVIALPGGSNYTMSNTRYQIGEKINVYDSNGSYKGITGTITSVANSHAQLSYYDESAANVYAEFVTSTGGFIANSVIQSVREDGYSYRATIQSLDDYRYSAISFEPKVLDFIKTDLIYQMQSYANGSTTTSSYENIVPSETYYFSQEKAVYSKSKELSILNGDHSNKIKVTLQSVSSYVSPLFDLDTSHTIFINNIISSNSYLEGIEIANSSTIGQTTSGGYALNKYISQVVTLADGQDAEDINVFLSAYRPPGTDVKVYIKILHADDPESISQKSWIELPKLGTADSVYSSLGNMKDFKEFSYGFPLRMLIGVDPITKVTGIVQYYAANTEYNGYKYFQIKIVLTADNPAIVPRVSDLRAIALQI